MTDRVLYSEVGAAAAAALARLWARAEARRTGEPIPATVDESAVDAVRTRLAEKGATAVLGVDGNKPVVGCFATQARVDDRAVMGRAHVSGIAVDPQRWGQGLASGALLYLEKVLVSARYDTVQLYVVKRTLALARFTSTSGGDLSAWENPIRLARMPPTRSGSRRKGDETHDDQRSPAREPIRGTTRTLGRRSSPLPAEVSRIYQGGDQRTGTSRMVAAGTK